MQELFHISLERVFSVDYCKVTFFVMDDNSLVREFDDGKNNFQYPPKKYESTQLLWKDLQKSISAFVDDHYDFVE